MDGLGILPQWQLSDHTSIREGLTMQVPDTHLDIMARFVAKWAGSTTKDRMIYILETLADRLKKSPVNRSVEDVMQEILRRS
jgi:hypothetical protein